MASLTILNTSICKGCKAPTFVNFKNEEFLLFPGSKHIVISPEGDIYHLDSICLSNTPEEIKRLSNVIPGNSITKFSKDVSFEKKNNYISTNCNICMDNDNKWLFMMPCTHMLCSECFVDWDNIKRKCPVCNQTNYGLKENFSTAIKKKHSCIRLQSQQVTSFKKPKLELKSQPVDSKLLRTCSQQTNSEIMASQVEFDITDDYDDFEDDTFRNHQEGPEDLPKISNYFDALRARSLGYTNSSSSISEEITPFQMPFSKVGDKFESNARNGIFMNGLTAKLTINGYNDLNCRIYELNESETTEYQSKGLLNYNNKSFQNSDISMYHSGDELRTIDYIEYLLQGIYIQIDSKFKIKLTFTDMPNKKKVINSVIECQEMLNAFDEIKNSISFTLDERKPKYIILCAQVTYQKNIPLKNLSLKNQTKIDPSCGLIIDRQVYSCSWDDDCNFNNWSKIFIYEK